MSERRCKCGTDALGGCQIHNHQAVAELERQIANLESEIEHLHQQIHITEDEAEQLRMLYHIFSRPLDTGIWRGPECKRLVELGYAEQRAVDVGNGEIILTAITRHGIRRAEMLDPPVRLT